MCNLSHLYMSKLIPISATVLEAMEKRMQEMEARLSQTLPVHLVDVTPQASLSDDGSPLSITRNDNSVSAAPSSPDLDVTILTPTTSRDLTLWRETPASESMFMLQMFHQCYGKTFPYLVNHKTFIPFSVSISSNHEHGRQNSPEEWCMSFIMLATIYRLRSKGSEDEDATRYADLAMQRISAIVLKPSILGVQSLLYMVDYYFNTPRTAQTLLAIAIRQIQILKMNQPLAPGHRPEEQLERDRIFWTAFIFDSSLSLRLGLPPMLISAGVSVKLPPETPDDGVGIVSTLEGHHRFNHLLQHIHLAILQDRVIREILDDPSIASEPAIHVVSMLKDLAGWCHAVPSEFWPDATRTTLSKKDGQLMLELYLHYFYTLALAHGLSIQNVTWLQQVAQLPHKGSKFDDFLQRHACCIAWGSQVAKLIGEMSVEAVMGKWYASLSI
jgi:hypothetical protein